MKFLCLYKPGKEPEGPPTSKDMETMGKFVEEAVKAGVLVGTEGCMHSSKGVRVRISGGQYLVTDGPFPETKELVAGMAILRVKSKEEAIEWTKRFLAVAGEGESEVRQVFEMPSGG
jgi:hypothetical protein